MDQGCAPVKANDKVAELPAQTVDDPEIVAVGLLLTTTAAVPVPTPLHAALLTAVILYVFDETGETGIKYGVVEIPVIDTGVTPSV